MENLRPSSEDHLSSSANPSIFSLSLVLRDTQGCRSLSGCWWPNEVTEPEDPDYQLIKKIFSAKSRKKLAAAAVSTTRAGSWYRTDLCIVTTGISRCRRIQWKKDLGLSVWSVSFVLTGGVQQEQERTSFLLFSFLFFSRTSINKSIFRKVISNYTLKFYGRFLWSLKGWCWGFFPCWVFTNNTGRLTLL